MHANAVKNQVSNWADRKVEVKEFSKYGSKVTGTADLQRKIQNFVGYYGNRKIKRGD